jgi:hypothetical protein
MTLKEMEAIGLPHKLFAVFTDSDGKLYYRKMWSLRLVAYLSAVGAVNGKGWEDFLKHAEVGQVWQMPLDDRHSWMVIVRIRDEEDKDDTV